MNMTIKTKLLFISLILPIALHILASVYLFTNIKDSVTPGMIISLTAIILTAVIFILLFHLFSRMGLKAKTETINRLDNALSKSISEKEKLAEIKNDLEIQLRHTQKLESIGTLAGGMAHDFNNLLSPILGYSDLVLSQLPQNNTLFLYVNEIVRAANKAKEQVEHVLHFSQQIDSKNKNVDLETIVQETVTVLRPLIPSTVEIKLQIEEEKTYVRADYSSINQILVNLCTNGWQAMNESGGILTIGTRKVAGEEDLVCLSVSDTGTGIDRETQKHMFEPFFSTRADRSSSGLGLSVVQGIVSSICGKIEVDSSPGRGSSFSVFLPITHYSQKNGTALSAENISGQIMVIDDDENITGLICNMLTDSGFDIELFNNSRDALQAFRDNPFKFKLILTDLTMPEMTGSAVKDEMKKIRKDIPVLIMTGYGSQNEDLDNIVLKKPFIKNELLASIEDILGDND